MSDSVAPTTEIEPAATSAEPLETGAPTELTSVSTPPGVGAASGKGVVPSFVSESNDQSKKKTQERIPLVKVLKLYVLPIVTVVGFIGITIVLVVPAIEETFRNFNKISSLGDQISSVDKDLVGLQALSDNSDEISADLESINSLVPTQATEVAAFQRKIVRQAQARGIKVVEVETVEQVLRAGESGIEALGIIEIPNNFILQGSLANLRTFILEMQTIDDFVIIGEMSLQQEPAFNNVWSLEIILIKYQFQTPNENNNLSQIYARVPIDSEPSEEILDLIRR